MSFCWAGTSAGANSPLAAFLADTRLHQETIIVKDGDVSREAEPAGRVPLAVLAAALASTCLKRIEQSIAG